MMNFEVTQKVDKEYEIKAQIRSKRFTTVDEKIGGEKVKYETEMFYLVPVETTHSMLFLNDWLPSVEDEVNEVVGILGSPLAKPARFGVRRANRDCPAHHLFLMSVDAEDELKRYVEYMRKVHKNIDYPSIQVHIMPASRETELKV